MDVEDEWWVENRVADELKCWQEVKPRGF